MLRHAMHEPPHGTTAVHPHAAIRVLLVEDDEDDYLLTGDLLRQVRGTAFEVRWTRTVPEGLAALAAETFDVVLLDYRLGELTGLHFLGRMPLDDSTPPVILLTGQGDESVDLAVMRMGAADYLAKGMLNPTMLERSVRYAVERHRAQLARHDAEQRYQQLVESVDAIVWQGDPETLQFTFVSRAAEHLLGYPVERWTNEPTFWVDHMHPDDRAWAPAFCGEATRRGEPHSFEYRMIAADGRVVWLRDIVRSVRSGRARMAAGVMVDVTAAKEAEEQLRRAERLATIGTLVGGVAHELNNPLAAIVGFTQLLLMEERAPREREDLETIRREAERMAEIVSNLRLLARDTQEPLPGREAVDLADVVRHVLRTRAYPLRTHNVQVREEIDADLPPVMGDRGQLEQVVLNLVVNAEQAMAAHERPGVLVVGAKATPGGVALHVSDNGSGIAPEHLQRIFDPFFTTKGPGEGTGLGLSLVHNLVAEHGGEVRVESRPGAGATFRVDLPATDAAVAAPRDQEEAPPPASRRILVVDDETPVRRVVARSLARRGHRVDEASEGGEALGLVDAARGAGDGYDLIISDLRMPGLDGLQFLARLRQQDESMAERLVFLTGDTADEACGRIRAEARIPVLTKPIDMTELARVVEAATA